REAPGVYATSVSGTERLVQPVAGAVAGPSWSPDGRSVAFNVIVGAKSSLMVGSTNIAAADEDVFPFRPQWVSSLELLYTADGKIKRRPAAGGPATTIEFTAEVTFARPAFTARRRDFAKAGPQ